MSAPRKSISLRTKLASALLTIVRPNDRGELERVIPHDMARQMSDDQIISLFHFDHYPIPHAHLGPDEAWNLEPRPIVEHRGVTAKIDVPRIAKAKRLAKATNALAAVLASKATGEPVELVQKPGKHVWPKGRKISQRKSQNSARSPDKWRGYVDGAA
ncbi:MAG: hypothetical protein JWR89_1132 [Tardiphaga sp.]|uniref:hypothetical protein n=1 Tax=Tardiphaga sp. TaxID=1926292 RepID=UPI002627A31E|nr:hypothetical protein [Tardiphaga sp.]MDB5501230.1 hypothetical protein [Tardiphaga sp.]